MPSKKFCWMMIRSVFIVLIVLRVVVFLERQCSCDTLGPHPLSKSTKTQVSSLKTSIISFYLDTDTYPRSLKDLVVANGSKKWDGPYVEPPTVPKDGWGRDFVYALTSGDSKYLIISLGADGKPNGTGEDADIWSWDCF